MGQIRPIIVLLAAFVLYAVVFHCSGIFFWGGLGVTAIALALGGRWASGDVLRKQFRFPGWHWMLEGGVLGAMALYVVFLIGGYCSTLIVPNGAGSIHSIYDRGDGVPQAVILAVLVIVASAEEIYWRGCLQPMLTERFGWFAAWIGTAALYAAVHIAAGNFVLFGAAGVAGLAFGLVASMRPGLFGVILMHLLFDITAFQIAPMRF